MAAPGGRWFLLVALVSATLLALAGYWALRWFDVDANPLVAVATALVVGTFVALMLLARRTPRAKLVDATLEAEDEAEGFDVERK